jgi:Flp pilus assembly protein TadG
MRFSMTAALLAASALSACANGNQGNPDSQPYATDPTGTIAVKPQFISTESYDPYGNPPPFADMQAGSSAITPAPQPPMNYGPAAPAQRTMPRQR